MRYLLLLLAGCAGGGTIIEHREGGTNISICAFFAICNTHGQNARAEGEDSKVKTETKLDQKNSVSPSTK